MDWQLQVDWRRDGGVSLVEVAGDLDLETAEGLRSVLDAACREPGPRVVVDLGGVRYVDSSGLRVLEHAARDLEVEGRHLVLRRAPDRFARAVRILGLSRLLAAFEEIPAAHASPGRRAAKSRGPRPAVP